MIVRCIKCGTKFRFDESRIGGDGCWVRCSRCSHVFFLDAPASETEKQQLDTFSDLFKADIFEENRLDKTEPEEPLIGDNEKNPFEFEKQSDSFEGLNEMKEQLIDKNDSVSKRSKKRGWLYVVIVLLLAGAGGASLAVFPEVGQQAASLASSGVSRLMAFIQGEGGKTEAEGPAQVQVSGLRQRFVNNVLGGNIRVVEGMATNLSSHDLTRIKIRGEIVGEGGVFLGEMEAFCGNLLTEEELTGMTEEQILKELSNPEGSDISNDRIVPKGEIPFMLVFTHEPPGVLKTFVVPAGAERLLP